MIALSGVAKHYGRRALFVDAEVHTIADGRPIAEGEQKSIGLILRVDQGVRGHW